MSAIRMTYAGGQKLFNVEGDFQIGVLQIESSLDLPTVSGCFGKRSKFPQRIRGVLNQQVYEVYTYLFRDLLKVGFSMAALALGVVIFRTLNAASLTMTERSMILPSFEPSLSIPDHPPFPALADAASNPGGIPACLGCDGNHRAKQSTIPDRLPRQDNLHAPGT